MTVTNRLVHPYSVCHCISNRQHYSEEEVGRMENTANYTMTSKRGVHTSLAKSVLASQQRTRVCLEDTAAN